MTIGIPKGLLYTKYHTFAETFLQELGAEILVSPDTNQSILDAGVHCCVDDACLPIKVYHGHVDWLKNRCDMMLVTRLISIKKKKYVCPMFCGLIEMIRSGIPDLPVLIDEPVYSIDNKELFRWAQRVGRYVTSRNTCIRSAYESAIRRQRLSDSGIEDHGASLTVALIGHPYIIHDRLLSMDLVRKLHNLGIGIVTEDTISDAAVLSRNKNLFKEPFWYFAARYYGAARELHRRIDGIIYISAFSCGVDSVVIELIKNDMQDIPILVLKIDEHTGEACFDTRIEAYSDMLKRRACFGRYDSTVREHLSCGESSV